VFEVVGSTAHEFDFVTEFGNHVADNLIQPGVVQALDHLAGADLVGIRRREQMHRIVPVGSGMAHCLPPLHGARKLNGLAEQQQFFGNCSLAGIGMGDDGEGSSRGKGLKECIGGGE